MKFHQERSLDEHRQYVREREQSEIEHRLAHDLAAESLRADTIIDMQRFFEKYSENPFVLTLAEAEEFYAPVRLDPQAFFQATPNEDVDDFPVDSPYADRKGTNSFSGSVAPRRHEVGRRAGGAGQRKAR